MKRQSKSSNLVKKSPFQSLLDTSLTPRNRSRLNNKSSSLPHQGPLLACPSSDETRDETVPKKPSSESRELYSEMLNEDSIKNSENGNSSSNPSLAMPPLFKECLSLYKSKQYRSAELLAMYNLTSLAPNSVYKPQALKLVADCAFHQSQYLRAASYYQQAFEDCSHETVHLNSLMYSLPGSQVAVSSAFQAELKHKESNCLLLSGNVVEASNLLESFIPIRSPFRSYSISMDLGKMYLTLGRLNDARRCFIDVLNKNIYALEAIECLAQIGSEKSAVTKIMQQKLSLIQSQATALSDKASSDSKENDQYGIDKSGTTTSIRSTRSISRPSFLLPISDIVNATFYSYRGASHALHAWNYWNKLLDLHPNHTYLLLQLATLQSRYPYLLDTATSLNLGSSTCLGGKSNIFAKIRSIDPTFIDGMEIYAYTLAKQCNKSELGRLSSDLLEIDDKRHESWACLALYHHTCGSIEKSIAFLEKAIAANPRSAFCHQLMGKILQGEGRMDHAIVSYFRANEISKDVTCYEALVEAYLSCAKYKEAVCTAKEAINFAPRDPRAMTLVGLALMSAPGSRERGRDKAKRTLKKAFGTDPTNRKALFSLVDLHLEEDEYNVCIELIKRGIDESDGYESSSYDSTSSQNYLGELYSKMAEVYIAKRTFGNALECYHKALSINPRCDEALQGMEDLEKLMKCIDTLGGGGSTSSDEYSYHSHIHHEQEYHPPSYRYDPRDLESVVRAI